MISDLFQASAPIADQEIFEAVLLREARLRALLKPSQTIGCNSFKLANIDLICMVFIVCDCSPYPFWETREQ